MANMNTIRKKARRAYRRYRVTKGFDTVAGFDILRYYEQGLLEITHPNFAEVFAEMYPVKPQYMVLRLAKSGHIRWKEVE